MFLFGKSGKLLPADSHHVIRDAVYVFEGQFTVNADKAKIVDTVLGLWSICLEVQGELLALVNVDRARTFPTEYFGDLPDLLEAETTAKAEMSTLKHLTKRRASLEDGRGLPAPVPLPTPPDPEVKKGVESRWESTGVYADLAA